MRTERRSMFTRMTAYLTAIAMAFCLLPVNLWQAEAAMTLKNPVITDNGDGTNNTTWDCVYFGSYPQSSDENEGFKTEPIKWRVLSVNGNDAFLMADKNLDVKPYNLEYVDVTWETCTLRSWLNGYDSSANTYGTDYTKDNFIDSAFASAEQAAIKKYCDLESGDDVQDKVYILSIDEVIEPAYGFSSDKADYDKARGAKNTDYAKYQNAWTSTSTEYENNGWWWLRSQGKWPYDAAYVRDDGYVNYLGYRVIDGTRAVRPVLHLDLSSDVWTYAGTVSSNGAVDEKEYPTINKEPLYPVMEEQDAKNFLAFLYNKEEIAKQDLSNDPIFKFLTGKYMPYSQEESDARNAFLSIVQSQINAHVEDSGVACDYLRETLLACMEEELGSKNITDDITEEVFQDVFGNTISSLKSTLHETMVGIVVNGCGLTLTQDMLDYMEMGTSIGGGIAAIPGKVDEIVNRTEAAVSATLLVLNQEYAGRYNYFAAYLSTRQMVDDPSELIFQTMLSANDLTAKDNNTFSFMTTLIPGKRSWMECTQIIDRWAETTYLIKVNGPQIGEDSIFAKKKQVITATDSYTMTYGYRPFSLGASAKTKLSYSSDNPYVVEVTNNGVVTITGTGKATITVTAAETNEYEGAEKKIVVTINKAGLSDQAASLSTISYMYNNTARKPTVIIPGLKEGRDFAVSYKNNINPGTATVTITGTGNYKGIITKTFTIIKGGQTITGAATFNKAYGNKAFSLGASAVGKLTYKTSNKKVATVSSSGKVTIKNTGRAIITVSAAATGTHDAAVKKVTINVSPKKVASLKAKSSKKKKATISWKKDTKASGYQIVYSTDKKFKKSVKKVNIGKSKTVKKTVSKLKSKKTYYVKVRAYKKVGSTKIYGPYSSVKKVKVK